MEFRVSYAQNREDFLIAAFFPDVDEGHYVDVGASHPTRYSVTKRFYDAGWRGINVEPIPELVDLLRRERPRDVTLQVGLGAAETSATFRHYAGDGLSTTSAEIMAKHEAEQTPGSDEFVEYSIDVTTLAAVLREHPLPQVHFLKIDVEGTEFDVLTGNDWDAFRPELICIETDHMVRDWTPILAAAGYEQAFHDGLNAYLLAPEARHRADLFRYPEAVLSAPALVTPEVGTELSHVTDLWDKVQLLTSQTTDLHTRNEALATHNADLESRQSELQAQSARMADKMAELSRRIEELSTDVDLRDAALAAERSVSALYAAREAELAARLHSTEEFLAGLISSQSWRYTKPIRRFFEMLRARLPRRLLAFVWRHVRPAIRAARQPAMGGEELSPDGAMMLDRLQAQAHAEDSA
ncbi:MAG TPA: FkbM family methyltransferase [Aeromicrobium sp.]|nr:FkbM family methyltransferase [Aeromicrobium sp.]